MSKEVYSSPYDELAFKSEKYAGNCQELHLGNRGITQLRDFEGFVSLDTLWLHNNRLSNLNGLEQNFRIRHLYLHNNSFRRLSEGLLEPFRFLETLTLNNNLLSDFDSTMNELRKLKNLKSLDLFDNPIAQEDNYRLRVLGELQTIQVFDRHSISSVEREKAIALKRESERLATESTKKSSRNRKRVVEKTPQEVQAYQYRLSVIVDKLREPIKIKRMGLEEKFAEHDPRTLGVVPFGVFWEIMGLYGVSDLLTREEKALVEEEFGCRPKVQSISATGTLPRPGINYHVFCEEILPAQLRVHPVPYRFRPVPEVSATTRALQTYLTKTDHIRRQREEEWTRTNMLSREGGRGQVEGHLSARITHCENEAVHGLSPWLYTQIQSMFTKLEASLLALNSAALASSQPTPNPSSAPKGKNTIPSSSAPPPSSSITPTTLFRPLDKLTRSDLHSILKQIMGIGKVPERGIQTVLSLLFGGEEYIDINTARAALGCPPPFKPKPVAPPPSTGKGSVSVPSSKAPDPSPAPPSPPPSILVRFRDLTEAERNKLQKSSFEKASHLLDSLLRSNGKPSGSDPSLNSLSSDAMRLATSATLLSSSPPSLTQSTLSSFSSSSFFSEQKKSTQSFSPSSSLRSDTLLLPNLLPLPASRPSSTPSSSSSSDNHFDGEQWVEYFSRLGLKGDQLATALQRKRQSHSAHLARIHTHSLPTTTTPSLSPPSKSQSRLSKLSVKEVRQGGPSPEERERYLANTTGKLVF